MANRSTQGRIKKVSRKTLVNKLDKLFSEIVRKRGKCEYCGKTDNLQCAHIYSRSNKQLRWDFENALCLDAGCHIYGWHREPAKYVKWAMTIKNFDYLEKKMQENRPIKIWELETKLEELKSML